MMAAANSTPDMGERIRKSERFNVAAGWEQRTQALYVLKSTSGRCVIDSASILMVTVNINVDKGRPTKVHKTNASPVCLSA